MDSSIFTAHLSCDSDGIWRPRKKEASEVVSYPDFGHESLFLIEDDSFWFQHRNNVILEIVRRNDLSTEGWILDIGGGNGCVASALEKSGISVAMLEAGDTGIANARARGISTIIHSTFAAAEFDNESVPAVGIFDVLEHQADPISFLSEIGRVLKKDGLVYVTVPANKWLWSYEDQVAGHYKRYSSRALREEFRRAGLQTLYISHFFRILVIPIFLLRVIPSFFLFRKFTPTGWQGRKDHKSEGGLAAKLIRLMLGKELLALQAGRTFSCGSSIIAVGKKL